MDVILSMNYYEWINLDFHYLFTDTGDLHWREAGNSGGVGGVEANT